jgi:hypothetical protein
MCKTKVELIAYDLKLAANKELARGYGYPKLLGNHVMSAWIPEGILIAMGYTPCE